MNKKEVLRALTAWSFPTLAAVSDVWAQRTGAWQTLILH